MSKARTEQRLVKHRGRSFHFVSYEGQPGNAARQVAPVEPAWFLMMAGKRWLAVPHLPDQDLAELDELLIRWLDEHVFEGNGAA